MADFPQFLSKIKLKITLTIDKEMYCLNCIDKFTGCIFGILSMKLLSLMYETND